VVLCFSVPLYMSEEKNDRYRLKKRSFFDDFYVFKDNNPDCLEEQKYKAVARKEGSLVAYTSSDGIHFDKEIFVTDKGAFDTLNVIFWDDIKKAYRGYIRSFRNFQEKKLL